VLADVSAPRFEIVGRTRIVTRDGEIGDGVLGGRRGRLVLAYLVVERHRAIDREELATVLWPDALPPTWGTALRGAVSKVRSMLSAAAVPGLDLVSSRQGMQVVVPDGMHVDWELTGDLVAEAEHFLSAGRPSDASTAARVATEIASGAFLPGLAGEWIDRQRERLTMLHIRGLDALARAHSARGEFGPAVAAAEYAIALDRVREQGYRALMRVHADANDRGAALRAYARCRTVLVEELGVSPSDETEQLHLALIGGVLPVGGAAGAGGAGAGSPASPFVGRDEEASELMAWWDAVGRGSTTVVAVTGEAGIGKTRLLAEFGVALQRQGISVARGTCDEGGRVPFQPLVQALGGTTATRSSDDRAAYLDQLVARVAEIAAGAPVLLILDDLHWAGEPTIHALRHLLDDLPARVGIAVAYRADEVHGRHPLVNLLASLSRDDRVRRLPLDGLDTSAVERLLVSAAGVELDPSARRLAEAVRDSTAGNAFLATTALRHLTETGAIRVDERGVVSAPEPGPASVLAPAMHDTIAARLGRLDDTAVDSLGVAAAMGIEFDLLVVGDCVTGGLDSAVDAADAAIAAGLVSYDGTTSSRCRFVHAVVRDELYERATPVRRLEWHRRIGHALAHRHGEAAVADLAYHFRVAAPLGETDNAVHYATAAASQAMRRFAYEDAVDVLRGSLELDVTPAQRAGLTLDIAEGLSRANDDVAAHEQFGAAADMARAAADPSTFGRAALGVVRGWRDGRQWIAEPAARAVLEEAVSWQERVDDERDGVLRIRLLGELALWTEAPRRHELAGRALDLAERLGTPEALTAAYSASRVVFWHPRDLGDRMEYAQRLLAQQSLVGDPFTLATVQLDRLADLISLGDREAVEDLLDDLRPLVARLRYRRLRWAVGLWPVVLALVDGRLGEANGLVDAAMATFDGAPELDAIMTEGALRAFVAALRGPSAFAIDVASSAVASLPDVAVWTSAFAWACANGGELERARQVLDRLSGGGDDGLPMDSTYTMCAALLAETCVATGDRERGRRYYDVLSPSAGRFVFLPGPGAFLGPVSATLARLARLLGDDERAAAHLDAARDEAAAIGAGFWVTRAEAAMG
jgi:DNA-binding SARP family transcriptional activator